MVVGRPHQHHRHQQLHHHHHQHFTQTTDGGGVADLVGVVGTTGEGVGIGGGGGPISSSSPYLKIEPLQRENFVGMLVIESSCVIRMCVLTGPYLS